VLEYHSMVSCELVRTETRESLFQIREVDVGCQVTLPRTVKYVHNFMVFEGLVTIVNSVSVSNR